LKETAAGLKFELKVESFLSEGVFVPGAEVMIRYYF
jgi:hypothetical protein